MKLRNLLVPMGVGLALLLSSCDGLVSKVADKVMTESMNFDYEDSEKYGKVVEKTLDLADFTKIDAAGAVKLVFAQDSVCSVRIRSNEKMLEKYEWEVRRGKLELQPKGGVKNVNKKSASVTLFVTAPLLERIEMAGGSKLDLVGMVDMPVNLEVETNGAAKVNVESLKVDNLDMTLNGASTLCANHITATEDVDVVLNGAGKANLSVFCNNLSVALNGAGKATVSGKCKHLKCDENGASKVDFSNLKRQ